MPESHDSKVEKVDEIWMYPNTRSFLGSMEWFDVPRFPGEFCGLTLEVNLNPLPDGYLYAADWPMKILRSVVLVEDGNLIQRVVQDPNSYTCGESSEAVYPDYEQSTTDPLSVKFQFNLLQNTYDTRKHFYRLMLMTCRVNDGLFTPANLPERDYEVLKTNKLYLTLVPTG